MEALKARARYCLGSIPEYGFLTGNHSESGLHTRFQMMDADSVVLDLIQCIEFTANKRNKRLRRMSYLAKILNLSEQVQQKVLDIQTRNFEDNSEGIVTLESVDTLIEQQECIGSKFHRNEVTVPFKQPIVQHFHNACKDALNDDGKVYDIFTCVAIIAFYELVISIQNSSTLRSQLLSTATLQFKGGASVGKFLLKSNVKLWNNLNEEDKKFAIDNFIRGGDNDTSVNFHYQPNEHHCMGVINEEIGSIMFDLSVIMIKVISEFNVADIMSQQFHQVENTEIKFDGTNFALESRMAKSFAVIDLEDNILECVPTFPKQNQLFNTTSYLEFLNQNRNLVKFFLTRIKAGFRAVNKDLGLTVNCYAECLDISGCCIDSAYVFKSTYVDVDLTMFV